MICPTCKVDHDGAECPVFGRPVDCGDAFTFGGPTSITCPACKRLSEFVICLAGEPPIEACIDCLRAAVTEHARLREELDTLNPLVDAWGPVIVALGGTLMGDDAAACGWALEKVEAMKAEIARLQEEHERRTAATITAGGRMLACSREVAAEFERLRRVEEAAQAVLASGNVANLDSAEVHVLAADHADALRALRDELGAKS